MNNRSALKKYLNKQYRMISQGITDVSIDTKELRLELERANYLE